MTDKQLKHAPLNNLKGFIRLTDHKIILIFIAFTFLIYLQVYQFGIVNFDDGPYVGRNLFVQNGLTLTGLKFAFTSFYQENWHPLTWVSYMLDAQLFGKWFGGFHLVNVFIHLLNAYLVFYWLGKLLKNTRTALWIAAFFAIHPQHVESVAWISERKDVLSVCFGLLSLIQYTKYSRTNNYKSYCYSISFFALSLMAKSMLVTLPCVLLLLDIWPLEKLTFGKMTRQIRRSRIFIDKIPFFILTLSISYVTYYIQATGGATYKNTEIQFLYRCMNACQSYAIYIIDFIFPRNLAIYYPHQGNGISTSWSLIAFSFLTLFTFFCWTQRHQKAWLIVGWLWFLGTLVPVIGLIQVGDQAMADRYNYFPSIGLSIIIFQSLQLFLEKKQHLYTRWCEWGLVLVWLIFALLCFIQIRVWENDITLFSHATAVTQNNRMSIARWGVALAQANRFKEAQPLLEDALSKKESVGINQYWLAKTYEGLGQKQKAQTHAKAAYLYEPTLLEAYYLWIKLEWETNGYSNASLEIIKELIEKDPTNPSIRELLSRYQMAKGQYPEAFENIQKAAKILPIPKYLEPELELALFLGNQEAAEQIALQLLKQNPTHGTAILELATLLYLQGRFNASLEFINRGLSLDPSNWELLNLLLRISPFISNQQDILTKFKMAALQGGNPAYEWLILEFELQNGKLERSQALLNKLTHQKIQPELLLLISKMELLLAQNLPKQALAFYKQHEQSSNPNPEFLRLGAKAARLSDDYLKEALEWIQKASSIDKFTRIENLLEEIHIQSQLGNESKAQELALKAKACYKHADEIVRLTLESKLIKWLSP